MRRGTVIAALLGAFVAVPAVAFADTINFDDLAQGAFAGNHYAGQGVTISSPGELFAFPAADTDTLPNFIYGSSNGGAAANAAITFTFATPQTFVSLYVYDFDQVPDQLFHVDFFTSAHVPIASFVNNHDNQAFSVASAQGIGIVTFTPSSDFEGVDTLIFRPGATPVPEPASFLLLGAGLIGLVRFARARR